MSYQRTFFVPFALKGGDQTTVIYKCPLTPSPTSTTFYAQHFASAVTVRLVSATGSVMVPLPATTRSAPFGAAAIVATDAEVTTVHQLAAGRGFATGGSSFSFSSADSVGLRSVLKGVFDAGDPPSLFIGISSDWNASGIDAIFGSMSITCEFSGTSNAESIQAALDAPTA